MRQERIRKTRQPRRPRPTEAAALVAVTAPANLNAADELLARIESLLESA